MSDKKIDILIVEDEMLIGANISMLLSELGYETAAILPSGEKALLYLQNDTPDIIIMDINLKGALDGIETVQQIQLNTDIPIIYLTANSDDAHFNRAKKTRPHAFISKPLRKLDLQRAIELTLSRMDEVTTEKEEDASSFLLEDRLFIRDNERMTKILIRDILYIEADRNYSQVHTTKKKYVMAVTLKNLENRLPANHFLRVHRSYIVNCAHIDSISELYAVIGKTQIPLSKTLKPELMRRVKMI